MIMRIKLFAIYMLAIDCSNWLLLLLLLLRKKLVLMLLMLKNRRMRGRDNGGDRGDGGRQLGL